MNKLILKEVTQDYAIYNYYPEGKDSFGEIKLYIKDKKVEIIKSENDKYGRYANKAEVAMLQFIETGYFPMKLTQAWY